MSSLIYANANSLFDYSNGASRSLLLLLETWAAAGIKVYAITSCVSDSEKGYEFSVNLWRSIQSSNETISPYIKKFIKNGVEHTLILNPSHMRQKLDNTIQELIYRETESCLRNQKSPNNKTGFIGWGNLLLEESLFRRANDFGCKTIFYLTNPTYLGKRASTLQIVDCVYTDSKATQRLYSGEVKVPINILPKIVGKSNDKISAEERWKKQTIYFINPSIKKGLQYGVELAYRFIQLNLKYKFVFVDAMSRLKSELNKLNLPTKNLPNNIEVKNGIPNADDLMADSSIILLLSIWHESGSRLILEGHKRGIPVLAFSTGGTPEFMSYASQDLFDKPKSESHWNSSSLVNRIEKLLTDMKLYSDHSNMLKAQLSIIEQENLNTALLVLNRTLKNDEK